MISGKLSIIIPFAQEHPQIAFTVQSIFAELHDRCDFEIIVIDNHCNELQEQLDKQGNKRDKGGEYMKSLAGGSRPWLKYLAYDTKLSHWQAKNMGVANSDGEFLWFVDSHCIPSRNALFDMFSYYREHHKELHGTLHMPLAYMLEKPGVELIYKLVTLPENGVVHYSFTRYKQSDKPYQVPCMSTCGMMMSREIYDKLGGWPEELGIYGGGEHFINFTLAVLGYSINIFPSWPLYHYAAPRGYHWNYDDYHRNRCIATFMFGGDAWAYKYIMNIKPHGAKHDDYKKAILSTIIGSKSCIKHRELIKNRQVTTIAYWLQNQAIILPDDLIDMNYVE